MRLLDMAGMRNAPLRARCYGMIIWSWRGIAVSMAIVVAVGMRMSVVAILTVEWHVCKIR